MSDHQEASPVFGVQARWLCFTGPRYDADADMHFPEDAEAAFLYLITGRTRADKIRELNETAKKQSAADGLRPGRDPYPVSAEDTETHFTRVRCPALGFDEEGPYADVWPEFMRAAGAEAERIGGKEYPDGHRCITVAWRGETRERLG